MTITRVNPAGWSVGDKILSSQLNALDLNGSYAADKRAGFTDTISALWQFSGAGRSIPSIMQGVDADHTYQADGGNTLISVHGLSAARSYSFSATNAAPGDMISITNYGSFPVEIKNELGARLTILGQFTSSGTSGAEFYSVDLIYTDQTTWRVWRTGKAALLAPIALAGTWICPPGIYNLLVDGCGGGGGGGGGAGGYSGGSVAKTSGGGGGGGGSVRSSQVIAVTPGTSYTITWGPGGTGGNFGNVGGFAGTPGSPGTASTWAITAGATLATWQGAGGGGRGLGQSISNWPFSFGGTSTPNGAPDSVTDPSIPNTLLLTAGRQPSEGGYTTNGGASAPFMVTTAGNASPQGWAGGAAGVPGTSSGGDIGGGAGGGGGGGGFGPGGNGAYGSNGSSIGGTFTPSAGTAAAANTGAGGGGGGACGAASGTAGNGSAGGAGGSGFTYAIPIR